MIDFEAELEAIITNDPLGVLQSKPKASSLVSTDSRLKSSFEEINNYIDQHGKEPQVSRDIAERKLFSRLMSLRENHEKIEMLMDADRHNLFEGIEPPEPVVIETIEDVLDSDPLGLLGEEPSAEELNIFDTTNLPNKRRSATDFIAQRRPCEHFEDYEHLFKTVHQHLREHKRQLLSFHDKGETLVEGNYYILNGVLLYLESTDWTRADEVIEGVRKRKDGRTRCIFENGTESNMYYRSLAKALYQDRKIVTQTQKELDESFTKNLSGVTNEDETTGFIYILKSLSPRPDIQALENLYKVEFSAASVEKRIANAENEPT